MGTIFNFINGPALDLNFHFGQRGVINFNFINTGYAPNSNFNFGIIKKNFDVLFGTTNNFTSVWVLNSKLYITNDVLNVIDLKSNTLCDWYSMTQKGRADEVLDNSNIVDIVVD